MNKGLDEAKSTGWTVMSMKSDWKQVFPLERKQGGRGISNVMVQGAETFLNGIPAASVAFKNI